MGKQYFLGLERIFGGSGDPAYPGAAVPTAPPPAALQKHAWAAWFMPRGAHRDSLQAPGLGCSGLRRLSCRCRTQAARIPP
jgi:hypothetical protein